LIALQRLANVAKRLKEQARGTPSGRSRNAPAQVQQTKATFNITAWLTSPVWIPGTAACGASVAERAHDPQGVILFWRRKQSVPKTSLKPRRIQRIF
jgi:hypothetical protein